MKSKQTETVETVTGERETPLERMERERDEAREALKTLIAQFHAHLRLQYHGSDGTCEHCRRAITKASRVFHDEVDR